MRIGSVFLFYKKEEKSGIIIILLFILFIRAIKASGVWPNMKLMQTLVLTVSAIHGVQMPLN